jgi:hypothetical protein
MKRTMLIVLLMAVVLAISGCASEFSKGDGPMFSATFKFFEAPMGHQTGVNHPVDVEKDDGPADDIASRSPSNPHLIAVPIK